MSGTAQQEQNLVQDVGARSVRAFCKWADMSNSTFYKEVAAGRLRVVKHGNKTLVTDEDGKAWLAGLPAGLGSPLKARPRTRSEEIAAESHTA